MPNAVHAMFFFGLPGPVCLKAWNSMSFSSFIFFVRDTIVDVFHLSLWARSLMPHVPDAATWRIRDFCSRDILFPFGKLI